MKIFIQLFIGTVTTIASTTNDQMGFSGLAILNGNLITGQRHNIVPLPSSMCKKHTIKKISDIYQEKEFSIPNWNSPIHRLCFNEWENSLLVADISQISTVLSDGIYTARDNFLCLSVACRLFKTFDWW